MLISTGTNTCASWYGPEKAFELIAGAGFEAVDYTLFNEWGVNTLQNGEAEIRKIHKATGSCGRSFGLRMEQAHAPMRWGKVLDSVIEKDVYGSSIACGAAGIKYLVFHPILPDAPCGIADYDNVKRRNLQMFTRLLPVLRDNDVTLCVENMYGKSIYTGAASATYPSYPEHLADYIDSMNDLAQEERAAACLDTGHMALSGINVSAAARVLGKRIKVLHVHDNNGKTDDHTLPQINKDAYGCSGVIDWKEFTRTLAEIGYTGTMNLESDGILSLFGEKHASDSLDIMAGIAHELSEMTAEKT